MLKFLKNLFSKKEDSVERNSFSPPKQMPPAPRIEDYYLGSSPLLRSIALLKEGESIEIPIPKKFLNNSYYYDVKGKIKQAQKHNDFFMRREYEVHDVLDENNQRCAWKVVFKSIVEDKGDVSLNLGGAFYNFKKSDYIDKIESLEIGQTVFFETPENYKYDPVKFQQQIHVKIHNNKTYKSSQLKGRKFSVKKSLDGLGFNVTRVPYNVRNQTEYVYQGKYPNIVNKAFSLKINESEVFDIGARTISDILSQQSKRFGKLSGHIMKFSCNKVSRHETRVTRVL